MAQFRTSRKFDVIFVLVVAVLVGLAAFYRTPIGDWVFFLHYHPSAQVAQTATDAGLSAKGRHLFYRGNPQFDTLAQINAACSIEHLGCLSGRGTIYILNDPSQHDQTIVTAAHEMLHLAYARLSSSQKATLAPLIDQAIAENDINGIETELQDEPTVADRRDEAHSLLGTEYANLPAALEQYYAQYFTNRSLVVAAAERSDPEP